MLAKINLRSDYIDIYKQELLGPSTVPFLWGPAKQDTLIVYGQATGNWFSLRRILYDNTYKY